MTPLVYRHMNPQPAPQHDVVPKRIQTKVGRPPAWRTVCATCEKFVMMVPAAEKRRVPTVFARLARL